MGFVIYKQHTDGDTVRYERLQSFRLAGPDGPIAQFVKTRTTEYAAHGWHLTPAALLQLAGLADSADNCTLLLDLTPRDSAEVCLYQLVQVNGVANGKTTHLLLDFEVLVDKRVEIPAAEFKTGFTVRPTPQPPQLRETLELSGGPAGGDWKWGAPALNIGATLVGSRRPGE